MKKLLYLSVVSSILISCSSNNDGVNLSTDKIVGNWNLFSQKTNSIETITDCKKQTTFNFEPDRILRQTFYSFINTDCKENSQIISSWAFSGDSKYRITNSSGVSQTLEFSFSENDTKFSISETDTNDIVTVSVFKKN